MLKSFHDICAFWETLSDYGALPWHVLTFSVPLASLQERKSTAAWAEGGLQVGLGQPFGSTGQVEWFCSGRPCSKPSETSSRMYCGSCGNSSACYVVHRSGACLIQGICAIMILR